MTHDRHLRVRASWLAASIGFAAGVYATLVVVARLRYGHPSTPTADERDSLLDGFMPSYDIAERHRIRVAAPAEVTLAAARDVDINASPVAHAIFRAREVLLRATPDDRPRPRGLVAEVQSLGWGVLADVPGREMVFGSVTKPWEANVTFRAVGPEAFAAFDEPGFVKIAWTLRADPVGASQSIFRTETRAIATDAIARKRFRGYWSLVSPGIVVIRWALLRPVKASAERRARLLSCDATGD